MFMHTTDKTKEHGRQFTILLTITKYYWEITNRGNNVLLL